MRWIIAIAFLGGLVCAQTSSAPRFEVASVKPGGDEFSTKPERSGGRIRWTTQLCYLVGYAYHLDFSHVSGANLGSIYAIEATFDPQASDNQVRLMFQSLLADRFKLQEHRITTQAQGYALLIGGRGLKIKEAKESGEPSYIAAHGIERDVIEIAARRASMAQLAGTLDRLSGAPVWDRTGLAGNYSFSFRYAREIPADIQTDAPSLAGALKETLGIKLEKQKGPVETLVIDHVEEPGEN